MYHSQSSKGKGKASDTGNDPRKSGNNLNSGARNEEDNKADPRRLPAGQLSKDKGAQVVSSPGESYHVVAGEASSSRRAEATPKIAATSAAPISTIMVTKTIPGTASTKSASIPVSQLCVQFCSLELNEFAECASFVKSHPEILVEDTRSLSQFAIMAYNEGKDEVFQKCIERIVMIRESKGDPQYINQLAKEARKKKKEFQALCDEMQQGLRGLAAKQPQKSQSSAPVAQQASGAASQPVATTSPQQSKAVPISQKTSGETQSRARKFSEGQASSLRPGAIPENQDPGLVTARRNPHGVSPSGLAPLSGRNRSSSMASLDERHLVRRQAHAFFKFGKVFKILWHQPAGADLSGTVNRANVSKGIYGEPFYSAIRWMVVVKERHGHCLCCPISSHGGTGLTQRNLRAEEVRAHAIVYASGNEPVPLTEEPVMTKNPIEIKLNPDVGRIDEASRVNFAKVHTIEWNYKVMEVGDVVKKHHPRLLRYCQDELGF